MIPTVSRNSDLREEQKKIHRTEVMRYVYIITISLLLASCGLSSEEKKNIAAVTCSIMGETRNMDAAVRVEKLNNAREKIGGEPFLGGDDAIKEAFKYGLCEELVLNENYNETLQIAAEKQAEENRIAAEIQAEKNRIAAEIKAEKNRIAAEKQKIADSKPTVKEEFHSNGKLKSRTNYKSKDSGGAQHGLIERYYKSGQLEFKSNYKDGKLDGLWERYDEKGQLERKVNYKNGKEDGVWEEYRENGQLAEKANYKDGKQDGLRETYYNNGQLQYKENYKDGKLDGLREEYRGNGQLWTKRNFKDGKLDGLSEWYEEDGDYLSATCWKRGESKDMSYCKPQ